MSSLSTKPRPLLVVLFCSLCCSSCSADVRSRKLDVRFTDDFEVFFTFRLPVVDEWSLATLRSRKLFDLLFSNDPLLLFRFLGFAVPRGLFVPGTTAHITSSAV